MDNQEKRKAFEVTFRTKYGWIVAEAHVYLETIFEKGLPKDKQVALMAQVLADRGVFPISEDAVPVPFDAITPYQAATIDLPRYKAVIAFVEEITQGNKPVGEVAANVIAFLEALPNQEERVVVFARMLRQGIAPYVSIPEGLIERKKKAVNTRIENVLKTEKFLRAMWLISRIFKEKDISNSQAVLACNKVLAGFADQPDVAAALLFQISESLKLPEALPKSFLAVLLQVHDKICTDPDCPVHALHK